MPPAPVIVLVALVSAAVLPLAPSLNAQTLRAAHAVISQSEDGPALENGFVFQPGEAAFFSFQVEGYKIGPGDKVQLTGHIQAFDEKGTPIVPRDEEVIGTSVSQEDRNWKPKLRSQIQIPSIAPPGSYTVRFEVTDGQTRQTASGTTAFPVGGKGVEPATALTIRDLGFYRTQEGGSPLRTVAYRAGDMLWVRFDMTGYKYGEQNAIDVAYDVAVLSPDGKQLFAQEDAAVEKSQSFYPQPWVPGAFNLSLQSNMSPGVYTLVVTARDGVGNQKTETRNEFRVE